MPKEIKFLAIQWNLINFLFFGWDTYRVYFLCVENSEIGYYTNWKHERYAFLMLETFPIYRELNFLFFFRTRWKRKTTDYPFSE